MKFWFSPLKCFYSSSSEVLPVGGIPALTAEKVSCHIQAFSFGELEIATCGFHSSNKIGEGGFGSVYKGKLRDGRRVAIKVLSAKSKQGEKEFLSEIYSMAKVNHENLVKLHGACIDGQSRFLVYDYMENGSLANILLGGGTKSKEKFDWNLRRETSLGIAKGLAHIHEEIKPHIVHRDIKSSNILLDKNFAPKVSDFGLSKLFSDNVTHLSTRVAGTLGYLAPEYAISGHLTRKSDVYSYGVLLLEIVSGRRAIDFDLRLGEHFLVEKAWELYEADELVQLVDPILKGTFSETEAIRLLKVGLLCVQEKSGLRPSMSLAVKMMTGQIQINDNDITEPALISDIMSVKVGHRTPRSSSGNYCKIPELYPLQLINNI